MRKLGHFGPVFPDGQGDRGNYCVPIHGTAQMPTQSKNSDDELTLNLESERLSGVLYDEQGTPAHLGLELKKISTTPIMS